MIRKGIIVAPLNEKAIERAGAEDLYVFTLKMDFPYTGKDGTTHHDYFLVEKMCSDSAKETERQKIAEFVGKQLTFVIASDVIQAKSGHYFQTNRLIEIRL